jgi:hypothetical protein
MKRVTVIATAAVLALGVASTADAKHGAKTPCAKKQCHKHKQKPRAKGGMHAVPSAQSIA